MSMKKHPLVMVLATVVLLGVLGAAACGGTAPAPAAPTPASKASSAATSPSTSPVSSSAAPSASPTVDPEWAKVVDAAKKEGKLTMYGQWPARADEVYRKRFGADYPGITLDFLTGAGSQVQERIRTEQRSGNYVADIIMSGNTSGRQMRRDGLTIPFAPPSLNDPSVKWRDENMVREDAAHSYNVFSFQVFGVIVNTNMVKPGEEPKSYKDLADPKWKGKLTGFSPKVGGEGGYWYGFMGKGLFGPKYYAGPDYLDKMKAQDIAWFTSYDDGANMVARGEAAIFFPGQASSSVRLRAAQAPIKFLHMSEGVLVTQICWAIVAHAPHANAAKVFINWLGTLNGQKALDELGDTVLRADVPVSAPENEPPKGAELLYFKSDEDEQKVTAVRAEAGAFFGIQ